VRLDDPVLVREEYESEHRLAARKAAHRYAEGPDPREVAFEAVAEIEPRRVLEVAAAKASWPNGSAASSAAMSLPSTSPSGWSS
jgi:hypothetical protein